MNCRGGGRHERLSCPGWDCVAIRELVEFPALHGQKGRRTAREAPSRAGAHFAMLADAHRRVLGLRLHVRVGIAVELIEELLKRSDALLELHVVLPELFVLLGVK